MVKIGGYLKFWLDYFELQFLICCQIIIIITIIIIIIIRNLWCTSFL